MYLKGNDQQSYPTERREDIVNQDFNAVTRTIWDLDTRPSDSEDEFEDDRFDFTDILDDDLSTLEELLGR